MRAHKETDISALLEAASEAIADLKWGKAIGYCDEILARKPTHVEAVHRKAYALRLRNGPEDLDRAEATLQRALAAEPRSYTLLAERGYLEAARSRWSDAERSYRAALDLERHYSYAVLGLAEVFIYTYRHGEAQALLEDLQAHDAADPDLALRLGWAQLYNGRPELALAQFERARGNTATAHSAKLGTAAAHLARHRYSGARAILNDLTSEFSDDALANLGLAWAFAMEGSGAEDGDAKDKSLEQAEDHCFRALGKRPNSIVALECLAFVHFHRKRVTTAEAHLRRAIATEPSEPRLHVRLGFLLLHLEDLVGAHDSFDQALGLAPSYDLALLGRASVLYGFGEYRSALRDFRRAMVLRPPDAHAAVGVGLSLARLGRLQEANHSLVQSLESVEPEDQWRVRLALAQVLVQTGEETGDPELFGEALAEAEEALEHRRKQSTRQRARTAALPSEMLVRLPR